MTEKELLALRLFNQQLSEQKFSSVKKLVQYMGAMQAQDYSMAKYAIGLRVPGCTDEMVENALNKKEIFRTHILRPTWHFVAAKDIRWMLELSAPYLRRAVLSMDKTMTDSFCKTINIQIEKILRDKHLTRIELMTALKEKGIKVNNSQSSYVMFQAEINGILCNGSRRGKQFTYSLLDETVPFTKPIKREEAIGELVMRYFTSHGPATIFDFSWWSGIGLTETRKAVSDLKSKLITQTINGTEYLLLKSQNIIPLKKSVFLIPSYDEFLVSYKDRSASLNKINNSAAITINGIFNPAIINNGRVCGLWKRIIKEKKIIIEPVFFDTEKKPSAKDLKSAVKKYEEFIAMKAEINI